MGQLRINCQHTSLIATTKKPFETECLQDLPQITINDLYRQIQAHSRASSSLGEEGFQFRISSYIRDYEGRSAATTGSPLTSSLAQSDSLMLDVLHISVFINHCAI